MSYNKINLTEPFQQGSEQGRLRFQLPFVGSEEAGQVPLRIEIHQQHMVASLSQFVSEIPCRRGFTHTTGMVEEGVSSGH